MCNFASFFETSFPSGKRFYLKFKHFNKTIQVLIIVCIQKKN